MEINVNKAMQLFMVPKTSFTVFIQSIIYFWVSFHEIHPSAVSRTFRNETLFIIQRQTGVCVFIWFLALRQNHEQFICLLNLWRLAFYFLNSFRVIIFFSVLIAFNDLQFLQTYCGLFELTLRFVYFFYLFEPTWIQTCFRSFPGHEHFAFFLFVLFFHVCFRFLLYV